MSVYHKTPMARKEAWSYCRRCLAVMLCCVLVFGLTVRTAPRAQASMVDGTSAVEIVGGPNLTVLQGGAASGGGSPGFNLTGSSVGALLLAASGVNMLVDSIDYSTTRYYSGTVNEEGNEFWAYLYDLGGDFAAWCMGIERSSIENGGIRPGDTFEVPAAVLEAARQWALENIDFTDGTATYTQNGIYTEDGLLTFSQFPPGAVWAQRYAIRVGSIVEIPGPGVSREFSFTDKKGNTYKYVFTGISETNRQHSISYFRNGELISSDDRFSSAPGAYVFALVPSSKTSGLYLAPVPLLLSNFTAVYQTGFGDSSKRFMLVDDFPDGYELGTTLTKTPALDEPKTEDITITIPKELPTVQVGELTIPVITEITSTDLTEIGGEADPSTDPKPSTGITPGQVTEAIKDALPITGSQLGDQVIEETVSEPDSLGGVFVSKFPFSIPWDIFKFVTLLAAEPVTPHWEIDFYGPLEGVGGFHAQGDTTLVIDFGSLEFMGQVCRWTCLAGFIYALASGTKRLIWTA